MKTEVPEKFASINYSSNISDEMSDLIGRRPHWIISWGNFFFFILAGFVLVGVWVIAYPDMVTTNLVLTSKDAPRSVVTRSEGMIDKLLIHDGEQVEKGDVLAYFESIADHDQVVELSRLTKILVNAITKDNWKALDPLSSADYAALGELQSDFHTFKREAISLKAFLSEGLVERKKSMLESELTDLDSMSRIIFEQLNTQVQDYNIAKEEFAIQEELYQKKAIALIEYKRERSKLLSRKMLVENMRSNLVQNKFSKSTRLKEIIELENTVRERKNSFLQVIHTFNMAIDKWKQKYILVAPVSGRISYSMPLQESQYLPANQQLMTVEPKFTMLQGLVHINQVNLGKLKIGQRVIIKLNSFPYREYGAIDGVLTQLSSVPGKDSVYWGAVSLPSGLRTRYGVVLTYKNGLTGTADIITDNRSLAARIFTSIRDGGIRL